MRLSRKRQRGVRGWILFALLPVLPAGMTWGAESIGSAAQHDQFLKGLTLVSRGDLDHGVQVMRSLQEQGVTDARVKRIENWLGAYTQATAERDALIAKDYERYVQWAHDDLEAGRWSQAAASCTLAFRNAQDEDAFRQEAWVLDLAEKTAAAARAFQDEKEWYKAARIWVRLAEFFPDNETYRDALDHCQDHIRLEMTYSPESDWRSSIDGVAPDMVRDAFRRIASDYLKEADFKRAVIGALEQVLRLTAEPELTKVFEGLKDDEKVEEFNSRIGFRLRYARTRDELSEHDLIAYFDRTLEINREIELFPEEMLVHEFAHGALQTLDKFSDMIWPSDVAEFKKHTQGKFSGVGIQIRKNAGEPILVVTPLKGSPAYGKGIRPGDMITKIEGRSVSKYTIARAVREITGPEGTPVTLTIQRDDEEFDVRLVRKDIVIETIKGYERDEEGDWEFMIDKELGIGCIRLTNFTEQSSADLERVVRQLKEAGLRGLIFDLRDNPGGPLTTSIEVSDLFLKEGELVVSTRNRENEEWRPPLTTPSDYTDFPMIVLVSQYSASASEIVSGALQVHGRALVLGERTYGKGSVQQVFQLNHSHMAFLKLTTQHYYLPDGRCLHKEEDATIWGVDPDIVYKPVPKERIKLYDLQLKKDIIKGKGQENLTDEDLKSVTRSQSSPSEDDDSDSEERPSTAPAAVANEDDAVDDDGEVFVERDDPNDFPDRDLQLEEALLLMRVRLESQEPWPDRPIEMAATPSESTGG